MQRDSLARERENMVWLDSCETRVCVCVFVHVCRGVHMHMHSCVCVCGKGQTPRREDSQLHPSVPPSPSPSTGPAHVRQRTTVRYK